MLDGKMPLSRTMLFHPKVPIIPGGATPKAISLLGSSICSDCDFRINSLIVSS
jgi:hypothetical protein